MPVQRFRSAEEMNAAPALERGGNPFDRFVRHCARYMILSPRVYPRGVFRFRSIGEAQDERKRVDDRAAGRGTDRP